MVKHCYSSLRIHAWWQQLDKPDSRNRAFNLEWTLKYEWRSVRLTAPLWDSTEQTYHLKLEPRVKEIQCLIQHWIILLVRHSASLQDLMSADHRYVQGWEFHQMFTHVGLLPTCRSWRWRRWWWRYYNQQSCSSSGHITGYLKTFLLDHHRLSLWRPKQIF